MSELMRETPDVDFKGFAHLVVIVGHEKKAPGASLALGGSEYKYNSEVALSMEEYAKKFSGLIKVSVVYRDGIGITGAYKKAVALQPDAAIELHFNAYNGKVTGTETLCSNSGVDKDFASLIHKKCCEIFKRQGNSRGVKVISRSARGGLSVYALSGQANCLVEPFFGDNKGEAQLALVQQVAYARGLVDSFVEWAKKTGLIHAS